MGNHGYLRITYYLEDCEGSQGIVCIKSVRVHFEKNGEQESVTLKDDAIIFNGAELSEVRLCNDTSFQYPHSTFS